MQKRAAPPGAGAFLVKTKPGGTISFLAALLILVTAIVAAPGKEAPRAGQLHLLQVCGSSLKPGKCVDESCERKGNLLRRECAWSGELPHGVSDLLHGAEDILRAG